ncbi:MAG: hypothetical protein NEHIOOID_00897 [Holosporales bacterium]
MTFGIYIHWPFCVSKCPYCDFNSHVMRSIEEDAWLTAIKNEISYHAPQFLDKALVSIFFGGGTPSLMAPKTVEAIIDHCQSLFGAPVEITLEANPNSAEREKFKDLKRAGVNRLSIGVQSLNQENLSFLGRSHSVQEAKAAITSAQEIFDNVSFDLIYALAHQSPQEWEKELHEALSFQTNHLSLYQLTIEPGTLFHKRFEAGDLKVTTQDLEFYDITNKTMQNAGFHVYEVSNYAKLNHECQHNLLYWRYQPFMGCGPGAHGRIHTQNEIYATQNYRSPKKWLEQAQQTHGMESCLNLTKMEAFEERLVMGLRIFDPVIVDKKDLPYLNIPVLKQLEEYIKWDKNELTITQKGRFVLDSVIRKILVDA